MMPRFASTFGAKSRRKKQRVEPNIRVVRRELIPQSEGHTAWIWWFAVSLIRMIMPVMGLCLFAVSGFSLNADPALLYGGVALLCLIFTAFYYDNWLTGARIAGAAAFVLVTAVLVLFLQNSFVSGFKQVGYTILAQMNSSYNGDYMIPTVTNVPKDISIFFLLIFIPITAYIGAFVVYRTDSLMVGMLFFPILAVLMLMSAKPSYTSAVLILLGFLAVLAADRVGYHKKIWGEKDSEQWDRNWQRRQKISSFSAVFICLIGSLLMIPSFFIIMPSLSVPIAQTTPFSNKVEGKFAQMILSYLPEEYRGEYSSQIAAFSGGVEDGGLSNTDGYLIDGVEDLSLSCTKKPQETLYLKGFVGGNYDNNRWTEPDEKTFISAASNWSTEGKSSIYINNIPFMRMLYDQNESGAESTAAELTVKRINANENYTYVPYNCYLNEYYEISGGDGSVKGQSVQDDIFSFYSRSEQTEMLEEEYFVQNESSFDRLERSYSAYVTDHYKDVPEGFERLQSQCDSAELTDADTEQIISYVQDYLTQNYNYSLDIAELPAGEDAVLNFLFESKTGYSPHYASAAVIMFRMFGIPSRYVVGYAASESLFTRQSDGTYQAVLQSDNAHAWAEIYISGTGWIPVETTPGQLGMVQDIEFYGKQLSADSNETADSAQNQNEFKPSAEPEQPDEPPHFGWLIITAAGAAAIVAAVLMQRRRVRDLGLNKRAEPSIRVRFIFAAYYRLLLRSGMPRSVESTSAEFAEWAVKLDTTLEKESFDHMLELVLESCFGQKTIDEKDVVWMRKRYCAAKEKLKFSFLRKKTE